MKQISKDRLEEIMNDSVRFPIFFVADPESPNDIVSVMTVLDIDQEFNELGLPKSLLLTRESGEGVQTVGEYVLVESYKDYENATLQNN